MAALREARESQLQSEDDIQRADRAMRRAFNELDEDGSGMLDLGELTRHEQGRIEVGTRL